MLTGLEPHTSGVVRVMGRDRFADTNSTKDKEEGSLVGLCPQYSILYPDLTAREHLMFYARLKRRTGGEEEMTEEVEE